jgi:hypothetical protein
MGRSVWMCRGGRCGGMLGTVDRFSKAFRPAEGVVVIGHGVSLTLICPVCGRPRVFAGWTMQAVRAGDGGASGTSGAGVRGVGAGSASF